MKKTIYNIIAIAIVAVLMPAQAVAAISWTVSK